MSLSSPERHRRAGRKLAISVAALVVCVLPTACDYAVASPPGTPTAPTDGHSGHGGVAVTTAPVVVPIVNQTSTEEQRRRGERRRTRTRTRTATPTVAPVETTTAPVETTAPPVETTTPPVDTATPPVGPVVTDTATTVPAVPPTSAPPAAQPVPLGRDCTNSTLIAHDGFQKSPACVSTAMGEVAAEDKLPSLLITGAPKTVAVGQTFMLEVSTRNLVRDRFLGAAAGGYYLESSFLNSEGLQRGHFHTACRILTSTTVAPDSSKVPEFFVATQDTKGGAAPDTVTIEVPGIKVAGELQCTSWAGDGSHRTPMMTKANQTPAIDSVRITVGGNAPAGAVAPQPDVSTADAQRDEAALVEGQQAEAGAQKPDQDGAVQPGGQDTVPQAVETGAPAATPDTASPSTPTPTVEESAGN